MNDNPLIWHPQWLVYHHGEQGVVLINKTDMMWLPFSQFAGIEYIDGKRCATDIGVELANSGGKPQRGALFWYQLPKLIQSDIVTDNVELTQFYRQASQQVAVSAAQRLGANDKAVVFSLSDNDQKWLTELAEVLLQSFGDYRADLNIDSIALLLVDDFLNPTIINQVEQLPTQLNQVIIIEVAAELGLSHCFSRDSFAQNWQEVTKRLWDNQPVRKAFAKMYPQQCSALPVLLFDLPLSSATKLWMVENLVGYYQPQPNQAFVVYVDIAQQQQRDSLTKKCIVPLPPADALPFAIQIERPVVLNSRLSVFDSDGGSRAVTPEQTVARLSPLVSEKTGVITHLQAFEAQQDNPIKIYRTGFFKTPTPSQCQQIDGDLFIQTCLGKGVSSIQSQASALCETIERYNAHYRDDVNLLCQSQSQMEQHHQCVGYGQLLPYSAAQFACFTDHSHPDSKLKQAAKPYDDSPVHWLPCWSLKSEQSVYVPLSLCFSQVPFDDVRFGRWGSNGCAAGNCLEEAILQGLLELIERDATAIWWYNRNVRQAFDLSRLDQANLAKLDQSLSRTHDYWVLDVTTDIGIAAMVAVGVDKQTGGYILGMGCHICPELAAQRALTELCQLIPIRDQNGAPFDFDAIDKADYLYPDSEKPMSDIAQRCFDKDMKAQVEFIVAAIAKLDMDTLVLNYSRAHVPLYTAKVFVPGLCHIWPQLGNPRLYQTPGNLGLAEQVYTEEQINSLALYI